MLILKYSYEEFTSSVRVSVRTRARELDLVWEVPDNSTQFSPIDSEYVKPTQFQCKPVVTMIIDEVMNIFPCSSEIWQRAGNSFNSHNRESRSVRQARVVYFKVA